MKTAVVLSVFLTIVLLAGTGFAQTESPIDRRVERLKTSLNLSEEQTGQVRLILTNAANETKQIRQLNQGDQEAIAAAMKDLRDRTSQQIENILTPDQQKKYQTIKDQFRAPGGNSGQELETLTERLNLTDEQAAKIEPILASAREQMQELRQNRSGDRQEMRSKMQSIFQERDKKIEEVLSDSQKKEYEKYQQERREQMMNRRGQRGGRMGQRPF
ncbi:MAG: hypothetical protein P8184_18340 [Calditrichia bacterium]